MDTQALVNALVGLPIGDLKYLLSTGSTNSDAAVWADAGAPDFSLVLAEEQTTGRGRSGRRWFTPYGAALAFSLVLRGDQVERTQALSRLTALGALAICTALDKEGCVISQIKWPNDVLLNQRKVAGVLTELYWEGEQLKSAILGIGVNVRSSSVPPSELVLFPAGYVDEISEHPVDRLLLLRSILEGLLAWRPRLSQPEFLEAWESRLAYQGEWVQVLDKGIVKQTGELEGLNPDGSLRLRDPSGIIRNIYSGDLSLRPQNLETGKNPSQM